MHDFNTIIHPNTKALIFDIDGTLADTMFLHYRACQLVGEKYQFEFPVDFFLANAGIPTVKTFTKLLNQGASSLDPILISEEKETIFLSLVHQALPMPLIAAIASQYKSMMPVSLGTGGSKEVASKIMHAIGMGNDFPIMVTSEMVSKHKPHPDTFLLCAELMGINPEFCQVFEDGEPGIDAAKAAGMRYTDVRLLNLASKPLL